MSTTDVVPGTAEEIPTDSHAGPSTEIARRERRSEVIRPLSANSLLDSFKEYQQLLPKLLSPEDYQDAGKGKKFVKKSGWRKIATAFDLDVTIVSSSVERAHDGSPARAEVIARAIAPSGRTMDGDGYCDVAEDRFSGPRGNKAKLENDLRATAATRAKNRAISDLVGMGEVSAEEVSAGPAAQLPTWAQRANDAQKAAANEAWGSLMRMLMVPEDRAIAAWQTIGGAFDGTMPAGFSTALGAIAAAGVKAPEPAQDAEVVDAELPLEGAKA